MNKFSRRQQFFVGLTLFSMFFGAGNLIFPPFLGAQAGSALVPAIFGMAVSAVGLPVLGVVAVAQAGGLHPLAARVHPKFADLFTLLAYLSIGPCLAIPALQPLRLRWLCCRLPASRRSGCVRCIRWSFLQWPLRLP